MRVLLTGSTGMLGETIRAAFAGHPLVELAGLSRSAQPGLRHYQIDLSQPTALSALAGEQFDYILHTAANVSVDGCEQDHARTHALHVKATAQLVKLFPAAHLAYISTDSVFDGRFPPYREDGVTNPLNYYAQTKLEGEQAARRAENHTVIRMSIFGFHRPVLRGSLAEWAFQCWRDSKPTPGFTDISFNPLYAGTLAGILRDAVLGIRKLPRGVLHLGSQGSLTKFCFLELLAEALGFSRTLVQPTRYADQNARFQATRPSNITLDTSHAAALGLPVPPIEEEIAKLAADLKSTKILP